MKNLNWYPNTRPFALAASLAMLSLLTACAPTAPLQKPEFTAPAAFKESALWKAVNPQAAEVPDAWWQLFNDPVLNTLQGQLVVGNETLKGNLAQLAVARAALAGSRAGQLPAVGLNAASSYGVNPGVANPSTANSLAANASWELDLWGRIAGGVAGSDARLQASSADLAAARLSLQALLTQNYFSMRQSEIQAELLERSVLAFRRSLELTQNRYAGGIVSAADVAQATTQLRSTQAQLIEANSSRAQAEHAIATQLGQPAALLSLPRKAALPKAPDVPQQLPSQLLERRPDIAAAAARVMAAQAQIGVAQSAFFPTISLSATAGFRGADALDLLNAPNFFWSVGPALALALFDNGARQSAVDSARGSTDQATATYRQTVLAALQEVEDNLVIAASLQEALVLQNDALDAATKSLDIANNQYKAGTVSYLNVVTAQTTLLASEQTLLGTQSRRLAAVSQLLKNLAGRWDMPPSTSKISISKN